MPSLRQAFAVIERLAQRQAVMGLGAVLDQVVEACTRRRAETRRGKLRPARAVVQRGGADAGFQQQLRPPQCGGLGIAGLPRVPCGPCGGVLGIVAHGGAPRLDQFQRLGRWRGQRRAG
ncbi:hypothetical protein D3C77_606720 [compost metagenome]